MLHTKRKIRLWLIAGEGINMYFLNLAEENKIISAV